MEENKAPEKLYIDSREHWRKSWTAFTTKAKGDDIEYTRTDALIEKACDAYCKVCGHYHHTTPNHICRQACDYYKDFVNYMKGE